MARERNDQTDSGLGRTGEKPLPRDRDARGEFAAMIDAVLDTPKDPERRVILIDGFNVLHATLDATTRASGWWSRSHRERLLRRITLWPGLQDQLWVAFDGAKPAWSVWTEAYLGDVGDVGDIAGSASGRAEGVGPPSSCERSRVHCVFVESADDWIVRRARRSPSPARTVIVSRDRQVAGRARSAGCEVWTPTALLGLLPERLY